MTAKRKARAWLTPALVVILLVLPFTLWRWQGEVASICTRLAELERPPPPPPMTAATTTAPPQPSPGLTATDKKKAPPAGEKK